MFREMGSFLVLLGLMLMACTLAGSASADPPAPCEYFGKLTILGSPAPPGTLVVGMINGQERGRIVTQVEGQYGSSCIFGQRLKIQPRDGEYVQGQIVRVEFFVNGVRADQTSFYNPGLMRWVDLTVSRVPTPTPTPPPDPQPVVIFNATPRTGYAPLQVGFSDQTPATVESWSWDFGDGTRSSDRNPLHLYRHPGSYSVNLTVSTRAGQSWCLMPGYIQVQEVSFVPFPGQANVSTDPDHDGLYDDLNGNGRAEFDDLALFFASMEWMAGTLPPNPFDFNLNGRVDFDDLYVLFDKIG